ncbi:MAG TPA: metal ABC transporter substrate-binding protein [Burkholderiales bacterium]|nr:metal ABC transporter substrate-binding protein [Burkholderiales bacterium]
MALAQEPLAIVTTTTDLRSLAEAVGAQRVTVAHLVPPNTDAEDYQPKPQDVQRLKRAKLVLRVGADYDLWFDRLLKQSGNGEIQRGAPGYVDGSVGIALLEVHGGQGGAAGHAHGSGNPHYWLDPRNSELISGYVLEALARVDAANAGFYDANRRAFLARLDEKLREWERRLEPLRGKPLIAYHNNWAYFARRFRLNLAGFIEPRPGVPPSAAHLAALIKRIQLDNIKIILRQAQEPAVNTEFLARKTGAQVVQLAASVGAVPEARNFFSLFDYNVAALAAAAR